MEVIQKYDLNDPILFRNFQKKNKVTDAPYHVIENVFDSTQVKNILDILSSYDDSAIDTEQFKNNEHLKWVYIKCRDSELDSPYNISKLVPEFKLYDDMIIEACLQANRSIWNLDINGVITTKYLIYEQDKYSDWHTDGAFGIHADISSDIMWRKLSATVALTEDEYEGGELEMVLSSTPSTSYVKIKQSKGSILLFPPFINHRIAPVTRGIRKTLVYWFCGPRWK